MEFSKGKKVTELNKVGSSKKTGTKLTFIPDEEILKEYAKLDVEKIKENLDLRAYITAKLKLELNVDNEKFTYYHENGIIDLINDINKNPISDVINLNFTDSYGNSYEIVFNYANEIGENINSFVNGIVTSRGTHETGLKTGLTYGILDYMKTNNLIPKKYEKLNIVGADVREGLYAVMSLRVLEPSFKGQVKDELSNPEISKEISSRVKEAIVTYLNDNPTIGKQIANRILAFAKSRNEINKSKNKIITLNSGSLGLQVSSKFKDCVSTDISENEIYIIEGDSASGGVNDSRDPEIQAVYPLKGKPLNTFNVSNSRILDNNELNEFILIIFGTTDLSKITEKDLRFGKIIILADADDDGSI